MDSNYVSPAQVKRNFAMLIAGLIVIFGILPFAYVRSTEPARQRKMQSERTEAMSKWSAWENWAASNCMLTGERDISTGGGIEANLTYACRDGKTYILPISQVDAAHICAGSDMEACFSNGLPQAPRSWPGAPR